MKNVLLVIRVVVLLVIVLSLVQCSEKPQMVLMPDEKSKIEKIEFPESLSVFYNGYQIGEAELSSKMGVYQVEFLDGMRSNCKTEYFLVKDDAFGFSYHIEVGEVMQNVQSDTDIDTCFYKIEPSKTGNEKVDKAIDVFKGLVDTLRSHKDMNDTVSKPN
jgi:hypothetical protein